MLIIIETEYMKDADEHIKDISAKLKDKIKKVYRQNREIKFVNNDILKFISINSNRRDGLSADVAIGPNASEYTCRSKQPKRVWETDDFNNYLRSL